MFPNVRTHRSRKSAFRMHGTYLLKKWLHDEKRVAQLTHKEDENDTVVAHVDRMVQKKEVPRTLREQWKPIRMELVEPPKARKATEQDKKELAEGGRLKVAPVGEEDVFDMDGAFEIERVLDHAVGEDGIVQFKVRYVGFGPKDDLWYDEEVLVVLAPGVVDEYRKNAEAKLELWDENPGWERRSGPRDKRREENRQRKTQSNVENDVFRGMGFSWNILGKDFSDKEKTDVVINLDFTVQKGVGSLLSTFLFFASRPLQA
jgi:hypothetical protein